MDVNSEAGAVFQVYKDGDMFCATFLPFTNIQEQDAGFGKTPLLAVTELFKQQINFI